MAVQIQSPTLGRGSDWNSFYATEPLQANDPFSPTDFGLLLISQPDAESALALLGGVPGPGGDTSISFADIEGTIGLDQFPPGSVATVDTIGEDAVYFYNDAISTPSLASASQIGAFISGHISFSDILGTIDQSQFPAGSVASLDSIDEDGIYFFDNALFVPKLIGKDDTLSFLLPDQTGHDGEFLQTNAGVLSWAAAASGGGTWGSITGTLSSQTDLQAALDAKQSLDSDLTTIAGLTATTDNFIVSVSSNWASRTPSQVRTTLGLVIGTNVQAWDADLDTWATKTPYAGTLTITTGKTLNATNNLTLSGTDGSTLDIGGGGTLGTAAYTSSGAYQPLDSDLTTIAGLTATTDNFIVSVSSAWASRTPSQVRTTLGLVIGTNVQAWDADLDTLAGLTATTDNFIVSVSSAWASRTPTQVRTTLGLTVGTNVQAWDADLDALAALSGTHTIYYRSAANTWSAVTVGTGLDFTGATLSATASSADKLGLTPTAVKTSSYTAVAGDFVPVDTTSGSVTITLTTAPADGSVIGIKHVIQGSTNTVTVNTGGSDVFNKAGGATSGTLTLLSQAFLLQYKSSSAIWYIVSDDLTLASLDLRFQPLNSNLTTIAGLTATTDNFIVSVSSAWASRTPSQVRTTLGLVIGTNVQAWDADLDTWSGITPASNVGTFLATPTSANLRSAMTDEIGTGANVFDGATLTLPMVFAACSSTTASLNLQAGTLQTTPADGDIEADANCFYGCTDAGNRGYIPIRHVIRADSTVTQSSDTNPHAIFTTPTNGRLTLETGTYLIRGQLAWTSMSATNGNLALDLLGAGTATTGSWLWRVFGIDGISATNATDGGSWCITSATPPSAVSAGTAQSCFVTIMGTFEVTVAGTIIPTQTLVTAAAAVLSIGSHLIFERIGSTSLTSIGQWD